MFNVRLAGGHLYGKQLFTWLSLVVSLMASFVLSFFPLDVLDEIWDLIKSVSEGFLTYSYDANSTSRFKIIKRHETELKWNQLLQTPYPLEFNNTIYHEGYLSKMPDFDVFSLLEFRKRTARSHGTKKNGNCKRKSVCSKVS